jgi:hypothetical protein
MAHFAKVHKNTKEVLQVVVISNDIVDPEETGTDNEALGIAHCQELWGDGVDYVQCSYNDNIRAKFPSMGGFYDETNDIFKEPQPFASWTTLNTTTGEYEPPIAHPTNYSDENGNWHWDEVAYQNDTNDPKTKGWVQAIAQIPE